jgi:L-ascorbate metabolism protein UlaG (beta-lactamase superfamily)
VTERIPLRNAENSSKGPGFRWAIVVLVFLVVGSALFLRNWSSFGGTVSGERLRRIEASPHYGDGKFENALPHPPLELSDVWRYLVEQFLGDQIRVPQSAIPISAIPTELMETQPPPGLRAIWLGHSSAYIELDGLRILIDPVFSDHASPISGVGPRRFHPPPIALTDLPNIDAVVISHDHYDHLDMRTIRYLSLKGPLFFVPLGVGAHLDEWEVPEGRIVELDWWESAEIGGVTIVCTPAQHYSSRGILDYKETFWSSWSIVGPEHRIFYSGDTGFSDHFQLVGSRLGPFDLGIVRIGQYGPGASWIYSNMSPEDAVQATLDVQARRMLPVHWGTFNIAFHDWDEPIKRAVAAANESNVELVTPRVGEVVTAGEPLASLNWWEEVR